MKLQELLKLSKVDRDATIHSIEEKMAAIGYPTLIEWMKHVIKAKAENDVHLKGLSISDSFNIEFTNGRLKKIILYYANYDYIEAELDCLGLRVVFHPEHEDTRLLIKIDGFDEFIEEATKISLEPEIKPLYKVGDTLIRKARGYSFKVDKIVDNFYISDTYNIIRFKDQDKWEIKTQ